MLGALVGDVSIDGALVVAEGARVEGDVQVGTLEIDGTLVGDAQATGVVRIGRTASVQGAWSGATVAVEEGAAVDLRLDNDFELDMRALLG